jgi:hypothetical protein
MAEDTTIITKKIKGNNRHWKNFLDKEYLGSHNLEKGEEMLLTIAKFEGEEEVTSQDGGKTNKQVLYFKEDAPKMILNITNGSTISHLYGSHPDGWVGKSIQVYATPVKAFGKTQDAIRIRDFVPKRNVDSNSNIKKLKASKTLAELKKNWEALSTSARNDAEVLKAKDELKKKLAPKKTK